MEALVAAGYLLGAYLLGAVPFSYLVARTVSGADLRRVGSGTVSGTGVFTSSGFFPMALAGLLDIGKGAAVVVPMAGSHPMLAACGAGAAVIGHNWSVFLRGAGGRAISVAGGTMLTMAAWWGALTLALGLAGGRLARATGVGCFVALAGLPAVLAVTRGSVGAVLGVALVVPMLVKRVVGNRPPAQRRPAVYLCRLVCDRDPRWLATGGGTD
jgi:glycerol-3-phosphate acyltransferase PlsY